MADTEKYRYCPFELLSNAEIQSLETFKLVNAQACAMQIARRSLLP